MAGNSNRSAARNRRRRRRRLRERRRQPASEERREWADLPRDVLTLVFRKLGGIEVLCRAQAVCRPWRQLALDPDFWRIIDMRGQPGQGNLVIDKGKLTRTAVDRCGGRVEELCIDYPRTNDLLKYVADRSTGLRRLVMISEYHVWNDGDGLVEFVTRCPLIEELQFTNCSFGYGTYRKVGLARPELKCFRLNGVYYKLHFPNDDDENDNLDNAANEIADSMPQLRELQLIGNQMTNKGLHAILEKCLQLESLDIRACFNVKVDAGVRVKLSKIKNVKLPGDSTANYEFMTRQEVDMFGEEYYSRHWGGFVGSDYVSDTDFNYDDFTGLDFFEDHDYDLMFGPGLL